MWDWWFVLVYSTLVKIASNFYLLWLSSWSLWLQLHHLCWDLYRRRHTCHLNFFFVQKIIISMKDKSTGRWTICSAPTHQWGQIPQLCRSSRRTHRRCCCPSLRTAGEISLWWLSSPHSSTTYSRHNLKKDKVEGVFFKMWSKPYEWADVAWRQWWMECSRESLESHSEVRQRLKLGAHQIIYKGSPRRTSFTRPHGYGWFSWASKNHVLTRAALSTALLCCLFLPHNCERARSSCSLHKKITTQGQAQHLLATRLWYGSDCLICEVNWQFSFHLNTRLTPG